MELWYQLLDLQKRPPRLGFCFLPQQMPVLPTVLAPARAQLRFSFLLQSTLCDTLLCLQQLLAEDASARALREVPL